MKIKAAVIIAILASNVASAETLEEIVRLSAEALKAEIYKSLEKSEEFAPHIPGKEKTEKEINLEKCKFWLDQYKLEPTLKKEEKLVTSCESAGIDMKKYQR